MFDAAEFPPLGVGLEYRAPRGRGRDGPVRVGPGFDYLEIQPPHVIFDPGLLDALDGTRAILHVSHLSLGSIGVPMDREYLRLTDRLLRRTDSPWMSEHISWNRFRGGDTHHFVLPFLGEEVLGTIVENARALRRLMGLPVLLENAPRTLILHLPGDGEEADFVRAALERAEAGLLLDLTSARTTAATRGLDLRDYLRALPLDRTIEVHADDPVTDHPILDALLEVAPVRAVTFGWDVFERCGEEPVAGAVADLRARIVAPRAPVVPGARCRKRAGPDGDAPVCLAPGVAATLRDGRLRVTGGERGVRLELPLEALPLLGHFAAPRPISDAFRLPGADGPAELGRRAAVVRTLLDAGALGPATAKAEPGADAVSGDRAWGDWDAALDFYLATRNGAEVAFATAEETDTVLSAKAAAAPQPPAYKDYWAHPHLPLSNPLLREAAPADFLDVLLRRRSARSFGPGPLREADLSALLFYVWGATSVQRNAHGDVFLRKTSPSGGSLHGAEVYPILLDVEGFEPGLYHYSVRRHGLTLLSREDPRAWIGHAAGGQAWIADAAAAFLTTFEVGRLSWKYGFSRAFRATMLDAGHLGQTFALVATHLGLGPFVTAALRDGIFEERLGLDYLAEPVLMLNGVGSLDPANPRPDRPRETSSGAATPPSSRHPR